jgi:hypothetical protein
MNKQFLCIHGGLSPELQTLDDLKSVSLHMELWARLSWIHSKSALSIFLRLIASVNPPPMAWCAIFFGLTHWKISEAKKRRKVLCITMSGVVRSFSGAYLVLFPYSWTIESRLFSSLRKVDGLISHIIVIKPLVPSSKEMDSYLSYAHTKLKTPGMLVSSRVSAKLIIVTDK